MVAYIWTSNFFKPFKYTLNLETSFQGYSVSYGIYIFNSAQIDIFATVYSSDFENSFVLPTNKGASQFINLPSEDLDLIVFTDFPDDVHLSHLKIDQNNDTYLVSLYPQNNNFYFSISSEETNVLVANSNYNDIETMNIIFSLSINHIIGDLNNDQIVNILDIVILIEHILNPSDEGLDGADINDDGDVNILDVVQLVNIILN